MRVGSNSRVVPSVAASPVSRVAASARRPAPRVVIAFACVVAAWLALVPVSRGEASPVSSEWVEWIGSGGLAAWTPAWKAGEADAAHEWRVVGDVSLDAADARRLSGKPGEGALLNGDRGRTSHLFSNAMHGDCEIHVEFVVPKGSNSGVYLMGRYEIQVFDSWGVERPEHSDCGGIYQRWDPARGRGREGFEGIPPRSNASRPPGEWQSFDAVFRAPRFDESGRKIADARFEKVVHNGVVVHENVAVTGPTRAAAFEDERPLGPLMLQGDHGPVAYRNVRIRAIE